MIVNIYSCDCYRWKTKKQKCTCSLIKPSFYVYFILKEMNILASNSNLKKKCYMLKYKISTLNIYISELSNTDIDPTVDFIFPVNKIDRENSDKNIAVLSQLVFLPSYWQTSCSFFQVYFWHSVNTHIWTSLLFILRIDHRIVWWHPTD
jgi:hypothetical protein